jgi:hypothetical protein
MIQDPSLVQQFTHFRFSAVVRAARSRSASCACQLFDRLTAGGAPSRVTESQAHAFCQNVKYRRCKNARDPSNASNRVKWHLL